jgi:hypothetical protein
MLQFIKKLELVGTLLPEKSQSPLAIAAILCCLMANVAGPEKLQSDTQ